MNMVKVYHGTSLENYYDILEEGLNVDSWVTMEYEDAEGYAIDKETLEEGSVICFEVPQNCFMDYFLEQEEPTLNHEHYITKKRLPKKFIIEMEGPVYSDAYIIT